MIDSAYIAIGVSVFMHVSWNLLARHVDARCNYLWWGLLAHLLLLGPWALWRLVQDSHWNAQLLYAMLVSAVANALYFFALRKAYHFAPVALVYPIARSSPLLIALWSWVLFDSALALHAWVGIIISVTGLWLLATSSVKGDTRHALPWALLAALATSVYSLSDKMAVTSLPGFGSQLGYISVGYLAAFTTLTVVQVKEHGNFWPSCRPKIAYILMGGLFIGSAYALVVRAMLALPASYVVSYTNAGIVLATLASLFIFKENQHGKRRLVAACIICFGLVVMAAGHHFYSWCLLCSE